MDDNFVWTPPGADADELENFLTLREGLPSNANESVHSWLVNNKSYEQVIEWSFMVDFQSACRVDLGINAIKYLAVEQAFSVFRTLSETQRTWLVDYELSRIPERNMGVRWPQRVKDLEKILRDAGSGWTVKPLQGRYRLVKALPGGVLDVVESTLSSADKSGELLRSAWNSAFGVNASPSHAYYDSVRAVEVLSCSLISPNDKNATLGKDIKVLRDGSHKWKFVMADSNNGTSLDKLISMMQLLWHSQTDRHGKADYKDVSVEEAQAAVLLAATIVAWLAKGMLSRVDESA